MSKKGSKGSFYRGLTIPARIFFDVMEDGDVRKLIKSGKPKQKKLEEAFEHTFDKYFELKNDGTLKLILKTRKRIILLYRKIGIIEAVIVSLSSFKFPEDKVKLLVEGLKKGGINLLNEAPLDRELVRILKIDLAGFKTHLALEENNLKELTKGESDNFTDTIVFYENVLERGINEDLTLAKFLSYSIVVNKKVNGFKKK